nr:uncharacterized protein CTRU02_05232 [Colletotrichum truncatum]KAF6794400.1 hypothetical protein CTRU02_05232 [Colletotrichum truncatum]
MSEEQWELICDEPEEFSRTKPKNNSEAFLRKSLDRFKRVWHILFPGTRFVLQSPFCEDISSSQIKEILLEEILDARARQALDRGEICAIDDFRAGRDLCSEMIQRALSIGALLPSGARERTPVADLSSRPPPLVLSIPRGNAESESLASGQTSPSLTAVKEPNVAATRPLEFLFQLSAERPRKRWAAFIEEKSIWRKAAGNSNCGDRGPETKGNTERYFFARRYLRLGVTVIRLDVGVNQGA